MPVLLALPLALVVFAALWVVLLPLSLWQRVRSGRARRKAVPWVHRLNVWVNALSLGVFALSAWLAHWWWEGVPRWTLGGWGVGVVLGALGYVLTRFERADGATYYTPNAALVWALTGVVVARMAAGVWQGLHVMLAGSAWPSSGWMSHAGLLGMAALLLGYSGSYSALLARRLRAP